MEKSEKPDLEIESPNLPYDIQQEILTWLPGKSLIRFQATCKLWNSWMRHPTFAKKHFDRGGRRYRCILYFLNFQEGESHIVTVDGSMQPHHKLLIDLRSLPEPMRFNYKISDSCNGIVCIYKTNCENNIVLYNPLTKESVLLPEPTTLISGDGKSYCYQDVYIGFIPSIDDYKIVCIYSENYSVSLRHCAVFSLSYWSWNKITLNIRIPVLLSPIIANGVMFWISVSGSSVLWFDLATEQSGIIDLPPDVMPYKIILSEVEGSLVFMYWYKKKYMSIWELQDVAQGIWMRRPPICNPIAVCVPESNSCFLGDVILDQRRASFSFFDTMYFFSILGDSQKVYYLDRYDKLFGQKYLNLRLQRSLHVHSLLSLKKYVPLNCGN